MASEEQVEISFDLIGDLNLDPDESFNWENKATSLYLLIAGNISADLRTVHQTLSHLSNFYQGILYVPGVAEYAVSDDYKERTKELYTLVKKLPNVAILYHHVVIIDGIAILGTNGWSIDNMSHLDNQLIKARFEDIAYLSKSVARLQTHGDVKQIIMLTSCIPGKHLYFGKVPSYIEDDFVFPDYCLGSDTEMKVTHWAFGGSKIATNTTHNNINYINNPYNPSGPYWPARINIQI